VSNNRVIIYGVNKHWSFFAQTDQQVDKIIASFTYGTHFSVTSRANVEDYSAVQWFNPSQIVSIMVEKTGKENQ
jgi:hypothetical protein